MSDGAEYTVEVEGTISWDLLFKYDNSNNTGTIREQVTVTTTESIDYTSYERDFNSTVRKEVESSHIGAETGLSYEGITAKVEASTDISTEVTDTLEKTTESTFKSSYSKTTTYERDVVVGPNSKLSLYQQRFTLPGISVQGSALNTAPGPPQTIKIQYLVRPIRFIKGITVVYGDSPSQAPSDRVREYSNGNDDINAGYGGKYVWLRPVYTYKVAEAATIFDLYIQGDAHNGWDDLAKGAGGSFRYLEPAADQANPTKLTDLRLYRSDNGVGAFPVPFTGHTGDINGNRGKSYLYLIWSTQPAY